MIAKKLWAKKKSAGKTKNKLSAKKTWNMHHCGWLKWITLQRKEKKRKCRTSRLCSDLSFALYSIQKAGWLAIVAPTVDHWTWQPKVSSSNPLTSAFCWNPWYGFVLLRDMQILTFTFHFGNWINFSLNRVKVMIWSKQHKCDSSAFWSG